MSELNTFLLMIELKRRLHNHLYETEPSADSFLEDLWSGNKEILDSLHNQMANLIHRYEQIIKERVDE